MIERDLTQDIKHVEPLETALSTDTRRRLRASPLVWHALWAPPSLLPVHGDSAYEQGGIVFTGHINCHDCALCVEAGPWGYGGIVVPWRRCYLDCTDQPDDPDVGLDDIAHVPDPIVGRWKPTNKQVRALRLALVNPRPGVYWMTHVRLRAVEVDRIDTAWMTSPAGAASRMTPFVTAADTIVGMKQSTLSPAPDCLKEWRDG